MVKTVIIPTLLGILLCSGCAPFAPARLQTPAVTVNKPYSIQVQGAGTDQLWWKNFDSPELNALINKALSDNFTVNIAFARLKQARANLTKSGADQYPTLNILGSAKGTTNSTQAKSGADRVYSNVEHYSIGAAASYELDLWGKIEAERSASEQQLFATQADLDAAAVTVSASVADTWVDILTVREEISILNKQVDYNRKALEFQELRFANGLAESVDVLQQRQILAASQSELPLLIAREQVLLNALSILIGESPLDQPDVTQCLLPKLIDLPSTGLPVQLLNNRPDIRSAAHKLFSAEWNVAKARADRLPQITLNADAAFTSGVAAVLFNNWAASLAGNLMQPVLDGGRRAAEVARTRALVEERSVQYSEVVARGIQEVEDALVNEEQQRKYLVLIAAQRDATAKTLEDAELRYLQGQSGYLPLLQEILNVQNLERKMINQQAQLIKLRISLYRALGGSWTEGLATPHDSLSSDEAKKEA